MTINGIEMITVRSLSDVKVAKSLIKKGFANMTESEKQQFMDGLRGAYNYTDFNRVESAVLHLANRFVEVGGEIKELAESLGVAYDSLLDVPYDAQKYEGVTGKTDWELGAILNDDERNAYLSRVVYVLEAFGVPLNFPQTLNGLTHIGANIIEKSLVDSNNALIKTQEDKEKLIRNTAKAWFYSGDLYGGEI